MHRPVIRPLVLLAAVALTAGACSSSSDGQATATSAAAGGPSTSAGQAAGTTVGTAPGEGTTDTTAPGTTAPAGDGTWHPQVRLQADEGTLTRFAEQLFAGLPVTLEGASLDLFDPRNSRLEVAATCADTQTAVAANAAAVDDEVWTDDSNGTEWWLVAAKGLEGENVAMAAGADPSTCIVEELPLTPVSATFGDAAVIGLAAVSCTDATGEGALVDVLGLPLDAARTQVDTIVASATDFVGPGTHQISADDDAALLTTSVWALRQEFSAEQAAGGGDDLPPGAHALTGSFTLTDGMRSGSLDVTADDGTHITATFACTTPEYTP